jgi:hypothetical protein
MMQMLPPDNRALATREDIGGVEIRIDRLEERMGRFEQRLDRFETSMERFDDRLHDFHGALRDQTRSFIVASTTSTLTVGALAFAAATLV